MAVILRCDVCGKEMSLKGSDWTRTYDVPYDWHVELIKPKGLANFFGAESKKEHYCSDICRVAGLGNHALSGKR